MDIQTRYNKIFKSHFIYSVDKEYRNDFDGGDTRINTTSKIIWSYVTPEWKEYFNDTKKNRNKLILFKEGKDIFTSSWEVDDLDEAKYCYMMFLFEDI